MNLFTITGEIVLRGKEQAEKQLLNLQGSTNSVTNKMETYFKRLGGVIITAFSVKALKNFALSLAETSATVHEEVAQFEAVLGDLQDKMNEGITRVSKNTGILETRLRKTSTAVFAMFKGANVSSETALTNTERFLQVASDASAFYDKSMEEVQSDLQSFMRGITRAGYGIGLYTSELQRNEKAMEKFGVSYDKLGQADRYEVMMDIIEQTYQLAGVTGQANREQEQWLNVTSNLKEAWKQFSAVLGQPIMEGLLKPIKKITDALLKWKTKLEELYKWVEEHKDVVDKAKEKFTLLATAIGLTVVALSGLTIIRNIIPMAEKLIALVAGNWVTILIAGLSMVAVLLVRLWNTSFDFQQNVSTVWESKMKPMINNVWDTIKPVVDNVIGLVGDVQELILAVWAKIEPIVSAVVTYITENLDVIVEALNSVISVLRGIVEALTALINGDFQGFLDGLVSAFSNAFTAIYNAFTFVWGLLYNAIYSAFDVVKNWLLTLADSIFNTLKEPFEKLKNFLVNFWDTIKETFTKLGTSIGSAIGDAVKSGINSVLSLVENTINKAIGFINGAIDIMNKVPLVNIPHVEELNIPKLAKGGLATDATLAEIGEAGQEAVIPLTDSGALKAIADALAGALTDVFDFSSLGLSFNLSDALSSIWSQIQQTDVFKQIATALGFPIQEEVAQVNNAIDETQSKAEEGTQSVWDKLKSAFKWIDTKLFTAEGKVAEVFSKISEKTEQILDYAESYIMPLFDSLTELQDQRAEQEIETLENNLETIKAQHEEENAIAEESYNSQLSDLYRMLDLGQMSYDDYISAVENLDAELEASKQAKLDEEAQAEQELLQKKDDLARKQFEAEKKSSIAMVWVNTATAIMKAFAELGVIGGAIATALLLATAGIQTATIAEQQYEPMLATGGVIDKPTHALIGEDGAEAVVPLEKNLGWVNGLANALEPAISTVNIDYTPHLQTISEQIDEMKQLLATFLPQFTQNIVLDGVTVARQLTPYLDSSLGQRQRLANRGM